MHEVCQVTIIRRPTPLGELISIRSVMERLFTDTFGQPRNAWLTAARSVAVDIHSSAIEPRQIQISPAGESEPATDSGTEQDS